MFQALLNGALLALCLLHAVSSRDSGTAKLNIIWAYSNPQSTLENGRRCVFPFGRGCRVRFQLCWWTGIKSPTAPCDKSVTTKVYKRVTEVTESIDIDITQPLPAVYSFRITATATWFIPLTATIGSFEAQRFTLKPDGVRREVQLRRTQTNPKNQQLKIVARMSLKCGSQFYGDYCEKFCMPDNQTQVCLPDGKRICHHGFRGSKCEWKDWCTLEPCGIQTTCLIKPDGSGRICLCNSAAAEDCTSIFDPCANNPCENDGICLADNDRSGNFTCDCVPPWTGTRCSKRLSACLVQAANVTDVSDAQGSTAETPCLNGGICLDDERTGGFICQCQPQWKGELCEQPTDSQNTSTALFIGLCVIVTSFLIFLSTIGTAIAIWWRKQHRKKKPLRNVTRPLPKVPTDSYLSGYVVMDDIKNQTNTYADITEHAKSLHGETDVPLLSDDSGMDVSYQSLESPLNWDKSALALQNTPCESVTVADQTGFSLNGIPQGASNLHSLNITTLTLKKQCEYV